MLDTSERILLRAAQVIAYEDMNAMIMSKVESLKKYAAKPDANAGYLERENKFLAAVSNYVNSTETLIEELDLKIDQEDKLIKDAAIILDEVQKHYSKITSNVEEKTHSV